MAVENVQVSSQTGFDGNSITTGVSNDKLTNQDFLKLMLEQLKMQDPTKPMDSKEMLNNQMQMSSIETNQATIKAMESLQKSFSGVGLTTAASMMGRIIENGETNDKGNQKQFYVDHVETINGEVYVSSKEISHTQAVVIGPKEGSIVDYDEEGYILKNGEKTELKIKLDENKNVEVDEETRRITVLDKEGKPIEQTDEEQYLFQGQFRQIFKPGTTNILLEKVTKIS